MCFPPPPPQHLVFFSPLECVKSRKSLYTLVGGEGEVTLTRARASAMVLFVSRLSFCRLCLSKGAVPPLLVSIGPSFLFEALLSRFRSPYIELTLALDKREENREERALVTSTHGSVLRVRMRSYCSLWSTHTHIRTSGPCRLEEQGVERGPPFGGYQGSPPLVLLPLC